MVDLTPLRLRARDLSARVAWYLPHDVRRELFLRARPTTAALYELMRTHDRLERPELGLSVQAADHLGCIFVHIPKTGGTSIGRTLFGNFEGNHMPIATYQMIYDETTFDRLFKFAVTRNPYDRLLSAYRMFRHGAERIPHDGITDMSLRPDVEQAVASYDDFEQFVLDWLNPANIRRHEHFRPQYRFACTPDGRLPLDYVGRFEAFDESFAYIAKRLGVEAALLHDRRSRRADDAVVRYADAFTPPMRRVVEQLYAKDLRMFDYQFGD